MFDEVNFNIYVHYHKINIKVVDTVLVVEINLLSVIAVWTLPYLLINFYDGIDEGEEKYSLEDNNV